MSRRLSNHSLSFQALGSILIPDSACQTLSWRNHPAWLIVCPNLYKMISPFLGFVVFALKWYPGTWFFNPSRRSSSLLWRFQSFAYQGTINLGNPICSRPLTIKWMQSQATPWTPVWWPGQVRPVRPGHGWWDQEDRPSGWLPLLPAIPSEHHQFNW